jgi:hypothetical protein
MSGGDSGQKTAGEGMARRMMSAIVLQDGAAWELPNILNADGRRIHGDDFYQLMMLWSLPLALEGEDIAGTCSADGFVGRILKAAARG